MSELCQWCGLESRNHLIAKMRDAGVAPSIISVVFGIGRGRISQILKKYPSELLKVTTREQAREAKRQRDALVIKMLDGGATADEVADRMSLQRETVNSIYRRAFR